jgi:hypothetical protein
MARRSWNSSGTKRRQPFEPSVPRVCAAAPYLAVRRSVSFGRSHSAPNARTGIGRGPQEPPRQLRWSDPVDSPARDPVPPPAPAPLPTTGRVGSRVSRRVLRPVSPPVADRVAPPAPGLHTGYAGPHRSPSPFVHDFSPSRRGCPQHIHIGADGGLEDGRGAGHQQPDHQDHSDDDADQDSAHERPPASISLRFACSPSGMQEACRWAGLGAPMPC